MTDGDIKLRVAPNGLARVSFNRPEVANAVRPQTMEALCAALDHCTASAAVRAIVITGEGRNFAAGADFGFLKDLTRTPTGEVNQKLYSWFKGAVERLWKCPKPVVAAVRGAAITVGCEVALACDARIASARSQFGETWLHLGLMPPLGGTLLLPRLVGLTHAKRMILEAAIVRGEEALRIGLIDELVEEEDILPHAEARALRMADFPAPAFAAAKAAIHRGFESTMETEWVANVLNQALLIGAEDFRSAVAARQKPPTH